MLAVRWHVIMTYDLTHLVVTPACKVHAPVVQGELHVASSVSEVPPHIAALRRGGREDPLAAQ